MYLREYHISGMPIFRVAKKEHEDAKDSLQKIKCLKNALTKNEPLKY